MKIRNAIKKGLAILALAGTITLNYNPKPYNPEKYAVLVCGINENRFISMLGRTYNTLLRIGFKKENVYVLDQDGKGLAGIDTMMEKDYPVYELSSKGNVKKIFSMLEKKIDGDDTFLVHFTDHGDRTTFLKDGKPKELSAIVLGEELLDEDELYECLSRIKPGLGVVTTDTCFGGGIANKVGKEDFIGISSSKEDVPSFSRGGRFFMDEFYQSFSDRTVSDTDKDGKISVGEAFRYAKKNCSWVAEPGNFVIRRFLFLPLFITPLLVSEKDPDSVSLE